MTGLRGRMLTKLRRVSATKAAAYGGGLCGASFDQWFDEYEKIDLGRALSHYQVMRHDGDNLYWRPFEYGYVLVNPTSHVITNITQFGKAHIMTHATLGYPLARLPVRARFYMPSHTALIVRTGR